MKATAMTLETLTTHAARSYLTDIGDGHYWLEAHGARVLATHLRRADLPATYGDWAGGFHGVDIPLPDGRTACLGYDGDDDQSTPADGWGVAVYTADYDRVSGVDFLSLTDAVSYVRSLLLG